MIRIGLVIMLFFATCKKSSEINDDPLNLKFNHLNEDTIIKKKQSCYFLNERVKKKCDSTLIKILNKNIFLRNIKWDKKNSFINCDHGQNIDLMKFGDSNCCNPRIYDLRYNIIIKNQSIYQFRMTAGPDEVFETVSPIVMGQLAAYKKLIQKKLIIGYEKAFKIAAENNLVGKQINIELFYNEDNNNDSSFYWIIDSHKKEDARQVIQIDANSGAVLHKSIITMKIN